MTVARSRLETQRRCLRLHSESGLHILSYTVLLIGLRGFGFWLARELHDQGHRVIGVDTQDDRVARHRRWLDHAIVGDAALPEDLKRLLGGIRHESVDLAVVDGAEALASCLLAVTALRDLGIARVIVVLDTVEAAEAVRALGVDDVVIPERDAAIGLAKRLPALLEPKGRAK